MFKYVPLAKQILDEHRENARLKAENQKHAADIDYIAMMCGVELETEEATGCEQA